MKPQSLIKSIKTVLIALACALCGFAAYAKSVPAEQIYNYARQNDYTSLKYLGSNIEAQDCDGNTAVCLALQKGDRHAYSVLVRYGANPHPRCERNLGLSRRAATSDNTVFGLSPTGWIVAAAVVTGGLGIAAIAASSGGGSGGGSDQNYGNCEGYKERCGVGYVETGETCRGLNGQLYKKCAPADCSDYDLYEAPENCKDLAICHSGAQISYKCNECKSGWHGDTCDIPNTCPYHTTGCSRGYEETGNTCNEGDTTYVECTPNKCEGYDLNPPHNLDTCNNFSVCWSGSTKMYKCEACNEGWNGTTCNNKNVCNYHTTECVPEEGYVETGNICYEGYDKYIECKPRDCSEYTLYKKPEKCEEIEWCKSGEDQPSLKCTRCRAGYEGTDCEKEIDCPYNTTSCPTGYDETGQTCQSGETVYKECVPHDCSDYPLEAIPENCAKPASCRSKDVTTYLCNQCKDGWEGDTCKKEVKCQYPDKECKKEDGYVPTGRTCMSGYEKFVECTENPCLGYPLTECPDGAECEKCKSGENDMYKATKCPEGWTGIRCDVPKDCAGYSKECEEGYIVVDPTDTCRYGDITYKKCEPRNCGPEYIYTECPAGYDDTGQTCQSGDKMLKWCALHKCQFHTTECKEGYVETGNTCQEGDQVYKECAITGNCSDYTLEECPVHAKDCESCKSGETIRYQIAECYPGWEGDNCNTPTECPYHTLSCDASKGEVDTGETCESGGKIYHKCEARPCTELGYTWEKCYEDRAKNCEKCTSDGQDYYKPAECREGWTGEYCNEMVACGNYPLETCPEHADCHHCKKGDQTKLEIHSCKIGYTNTGRECVPNDEVTNTRSAKFLSRTVGAYYTEETNAVHGEDIMLHNADGVSVIGIYADNASVVNAADISINKAQIEETDESGDVVAVKEADLPTGYAVGMYANSGSSVVNNGTVKISGAEVAVGMYGEDGTEEAPTIVENAGEIDITDSQKAYGIWAAGKNVVVKNSGIIKIDNHARTDQCSGSDCSNDSYAIVLNGGTLFQNGLLQADYFNTADVGGMVVATATAHFEVAKEMKGDLLLSSDVVSEGFDNTYTVADMIDAGDVSKLNLHSQSALFDAELQNESDAVLTMKPFTEVTENPSVAAFLSQNYAAGNNEELFNLLKAEDSSAALTSTINKLTADDVFNRFNFEDMTMMRELNADVNNKLFTDTNDHLTTSGSIAPFYFESGSGSNARYALYNTRTGRISLGLSMAFSNVSSSDRHNNNTRKDETFQMSVPLGYNRRGFKLITAPRFGYAYGTYDRNGYNRTYDGTVEKRMLGLMNEVRYPLDMGGWSLAPAAEFNLLGYHIKGHEDGAPFALNIKSQNNYSVESGLGLYANKDLRFGKGQRLQMRAGIAAYHEFADPYTTELEMQGMSGSFKIRDERRKDDRMVIRAGFDYSLGDDFSLLGTIASYIDGTTHTNANLDFKYRF